MGGVVSRRERDPPAEDQGPLGDDSLLPAEDPLELEFQVLLAMQLGLEFEAVPFFTLYLNSGDEMQVWTADLARVSEVFYRFAQGVDNENAGYDLAEFHDLAVRSLIEAINSEERSPQITLEYFKDILKLSLQLEIEWAVKCCYKWFSQQILAIENVTADTVGPLMKEACFIWNKFWEFSNMEPLNILTKRVYELNARSTFVELLCQQKSLPD